MPTTYTAIATVTVGSGGASSIDFTSIPGTYTDLLLKMSLRSATSGSNDGILMKVNSITSGYSNRILWGDGTYPGSESNPYGSTNAYYITSAVTGTYTASTFSSCDVYLPNYAGSTNKSLSADTTQENNATYSFMTLNAGLLSNTAVVSSLNIYTTSGSGFAQYSKFYLYGIKNS